MVVQQHILNWLYSVLTSVWYRPTALAVLDASCVSVEA